jgi:hypothetical protein
MASINPYKSRVDWIRKYVLTESVYFRIQWQSGRIQPLKWRTTMGEDSTTDRTFNPGTFCAPPRSYDKYRSEGPTVSDYSQEQSKAAWELSKLDTPTLALLASMDDEALEAMLEQLSILRTTVSTPAMSVTEMRRLLDGLRNRDPEIMNEVLQLLNSPTPKNLPPSAA